MKKSFNLEGRDCEDCAYGETYENEHPCMVCVVFTTRPGYVPEGCLRVRHERRGGR